MSQSLLNRAPNLRTAPSPLRTWNLLLLDAEFWLQSLVQHSPSPRIASQVTSGRLQHLLLQMHSRLQALVLEQTQAYLYTFHNPNNQT